MMSSGAATPRRFRSSRSGPRSSVRPSLGCIVFPRLPGSARPWNRDTTVLDLLLCAWGCPHVLSLAEIAALAGQGRDAALYLPKGETGDVKLDPAPPRVKTPHRYLAFRHGLPAAVAALPVARTAPDACEAIVRQAAIGEPLPNQETKYGFVHGGLAAFSGSRRQIHRGLGASGANPKGRGAGGKIIGPAPLKRLVDFGPPCPRHYVVEEAVESGLDHITLVTGRNKRAIEDRFDAAFELE